MTGVDAAALRRAVDPAAEVVGWATVELDRAERELAGGRSVTSEPRLRDAHLGAACRLVGLPDRQVLLLEPDTEGRLAASLARFGEGPAATYLVARPGAVDRVREAGFVVSAELDGPFGRQRLVVVGPAWGPHHVLVLAASSPPATIRL